MGDWPQQPDPETRNRLNEALNTILVEIRDDE